jgi:glucuronosyltransferase
MEALMKEAFHLEKAPSMLEIERNASLVFINAHHATDFARALPPMFVNIGGMQCWQKEKPLPKEFKEYLDGAEHGAILMSFGSTIDLSRIPEMYKKIFFDMVRKFDKVRFIWRWNGPLPADAPKNLMASNWLPQYQILGHPKIRAFISHGGLNSLTEATCNGVPVIIVPLFADQDFNGFRVEAQEIGMRVEVRDLTSRAMQNAVHQILTDSKFSKNMKKKSLVLRDRPMSPVDTAVYWTEFVLRHEDTASLKPMMNVDWFQRRMYDGILVILLAAILSVAMLAYMAKALYARISGGFFSKVTAEVGKVISLDVKKTD